MRRPRDICLLSRHLLKSPNPIFYATRSRHGKPFVASPLVLELDSVDSKLVRKLEESADATPQSLLRDPSDPMSSEKKAMAQKRTTFGSRSLMRLDNVEHSFQLRSVTAPDLLSYALLGSPWPHDNLRNAQLRLVFSLKQIQPQDTIESNIRKLAFGFTTEPSITLQNAGFIPEHEASVRRMIAKSSTFPRLRRMISMISSTVEGCKFLALNGAAIVEGIAYARKKSLALDDRRVSSKMVLRMLNNLHLNMRSKGVEMGPELCNAGIYYASKCFVLPAVSTYLRLAREQSYPTNGLTARAVMALMGHLTLWPTLQHGKRMNKILNTPRDGDFDRKDAVKLLTGWNSNGVPQAGETRQQNSFAALLSQDQCQDIEDNIYPNYIFGLGELGMTEALLHEWRSLDETTVPPFLQGKWSQKARTEVFAIAFLIAKDSERALMVLKSLSKDSVENSPAAIPLHGSKLIDNTGHNPTIIQRLFSYYYYFHGVNPRADLREELEQGIPGDPQLALAALSRLVWGPLAQSTDLDGVTKTKEKRVGEENFPNAANVRILRMTN